MSITKDEIQDRIRRVLVEQLGVRSDEIRHDSRIKGDLGADELDVVETAMALEEEFDIDEITDEAIGNCQDDPTFAQWVDIVEAAVRKKEETGPLKTVRR